MFLVALLECEHIIVVNSNGEILSRIKDIMDNHRTEIVSKFGAIISGLVKKEVATALKP